MQDMFYKYDHKIAPLCNECAFECDPNNPPQFCPLYAKQNELSHRTCLSLIYSINNKLLGVMARENSKFRLFFPVCSIKDYHKLMEALKQAEFRFTIFNRLHKELLTAPVDVNFDSGVLSVELQSSSEGPLKAGIYRMRLDMVIDETIYTLFAENDGILSII